MRLRAEYRVGPELRFLGNLDMMHLMERALRRASIPFALSQGFNPHVKLSMGTVLPVGLWGEKEYFDLELYKDIAVEDFIKRMNNSLPVHMFINKCVEISAATPSLMKVINAASYRFCIREPGLDLNLWKNEFLARDSLVIKSRGKKKDIAKDLRPGIFKVTVQKCHNFDIIEIWASTGPPVNVRYDELVEVMTLTGLNKKSIGDVFRSGNYIKEGLEYYSPMKR